MKLHITTFAALVALSAADRTRGLKRFGGDLQSKLDSMCPDLVSGCGVLDSGDCEMGEKPERPGSDASQVRLSPAHTPSPSLVLVLTDMCVPPPNPRRRRMPSKS